MAVDIAGLERRARDLLAPGAYAYFAGGAGQERTLQASVRAWRRYWLAPRVLRDVSSVDTGVLLPAGPPPRLRPTAAAVATAFQRLLPPDGGVVTAGGAAAAGALMVL